MKMTNALKTKSQYAVLICLAEAGPYRMKDLIRIFRCNNKKMSNILNNLESGYLVCSGMKGKTRWYGVTYGAERYLELLDDFI